MVTVDELYRKMSEGAVLTPDDLNSPNFRQAAEKFERNTGRPYFLQRSTPPPVTFVSQKNPGKTTKGE